MDDRERTIRRRVSVGITVVALLGLAVLLTIYRDYSGWFAYDASASLDPRLRLLERAEFSTKYEVRLATPSGEDIVGLLALPTSPPPHPVIILQGGYHRGKEAVNLIGGEVLRRGYAVFSMDYRYTGSLDNRVLLYFQVRGAMRDATLDLRRVLDYFEARQDLDPDGVVLVGVSLGALFGPIVTAVDGRIDYLALIYGGGNLSKVIRANSTVHPLLTEIVVAVSRVVYAPFEPLQYADRISPAPLLMIHGTGDRWVPAECARVFFEKVDGPKRIIWHEHGHIRSFHDEEIRKLVNECLGWLDEEFQRANG